MHDNTVCALFRCALFCCAYVLAHGHDSSCRYGYTEVPDQGHSFMEMVLLTVLGKLYKELHAAMQNSPEVSAQSPALVNTHPQLILAAIVVAVAPAAHQAVSLGLVSLS